MTVPGPAVTLQVRDEDKVLEPHRVSCRLPGQRPEGMPTLACQSRALPNVQRLAVHRGH